MLGFLPSVRPELVDAERAEGDAHDASRPVHELVGVGTVLNGKYRLLELLGEGGMGSVYLAHSNALDVEVAVKLIRADLIEGEGERLSDRLLHEARAAAHVDHPAILRVFDFGKTPQGEPFLVMEKLDGEDLASLLARHGSMAPVRAVQLLLPIVHGLAAAHDKGIVHRDIKLGNVFLAFLEDGTLQPKLIDFGLATLHQHNTSGLALSQTIVGTPGYMSPEQVRGEEAGPAADIWALCVMLYEMLTGKLPFTGHTDNALMCAVLLHGPEPLAACGVQEPELWTIIEKGLAGQPVERWPSARSLGMALAGWLMAQGITEDVAAGSLTHQWSVEPSFWVPDSWYDLEPRLPMSPSSPAGGSTLRSTVIPIAPVVAKRRGAGMLIALGLVALAVLGVAGLVVWPVSSRANEEPSVAAPAARAMAVAEPGVEETTPTLPSQGDGSPTRTNDSGSSAPPASSPVEASRAATSSPPTPAARLLGLGFMPTSRWASRSSQEPSSRHEPLLGAAADPVLEVPTRLAEQPVQRDVYPDDGRLADGGVGRAEHGPPSGVAEHGPPSGVADELADEYEARQRQVRELVGQGLSAEAPSAVGTRPRDRRAVEGVHAAERGW